MMHDPLFRDPLENVVSHSPTATQVYLGSPSLALDPDYGIIASHDFFGPKNPRDRYGREYATRIYRSTDKGKGWEQVADIRGAFWSNLHRHRGALFLLGCSAHYGDIVIRRSDDGGVTWTEPLDEDSGMLFTGGKGTQPPNYHCAPVPVLEHRGRLWRAFEDNYTAQWPDFDATIISAKANADLLKASSWAMTNKLRYDRDGYPPAFSNHRAGWLEGNAVATPSGDVWNILRVNTPNESWRLSEQKEKDVRWSNIAAITRVSLDGRKLTFDPKTGFIDFPGGMSKFTIRFDEATGRYLALTNEVFNHNNPWQRNVLVLISSRDLVHWKRHCVLLYSYEDEELVGKECNIGFQYVDWIFDEDDILLLVRTAYNGAHNFHDANYITFHRIINYRQLL